jgi:hypothetical protein
MQPGDDALAGVAVYLVLPELAADGAHLHVSPDGITDERHELLDHGEGFGDGRFALLVQILTAFVDLLQVQLVAFDWVKGHDGPPFL